MTIAQPTSNLVSRVNDRLGHLGLANPISVLSPPTLRIFDSGNTALFVWPAAYLGFVLESSDCLSPVARIVVPYTPAQPGDQNMLPMILSGTNSYYRLWFPDP